MEVSHFELIYKPQAPVGPGGTGPVDVVLQGYFLEITNLENTEYLYRLDFIATPPAAGQTQRSLAGNTLVFIDTPGVNNAPGVLHGGFASSTFSPSQGLIRVPPRTTALVAVLPSVFGAGTPDSTPIAITDQTFEVRGYVRIRLPALLVFDGIFIRFVPQAEAPVKVLLTPQNRTSYYRPNGNLSDQTQATLTTANGQGVALLPPESGFIFLGDLALDKRAFELVDPIPEEDRADVLAALIAQIAPDADLKAFNRVLAERKVPLALEKRAGRAEGRGQPLASAEPA